MTDCIFCKIIKGESPAKVIYQDDDTIVFHDIRPAAPTHLLVCPKKHYDTLMDTPADVMPKLFEVTQMIAKEQGLDEKGFRVIVNNGRGGGQVIFHLHLHLLSGGRLPGFH